MCPLGNYFLTSKAIYDCVFKFWLLWMHLQTLITINAHSSAIPFKKPEKTEKKLTVKELKIENVGGREWQGIEQRRFHIYHEITTEFRV